ncbi:MAG TPA: hypothetical protein VHT48_08480 [Methylocella sp.]|nr:hypothetical protein [Methylocella sp.]
MLRRCLERKSTCGALPRDNFPWTILLALAAGPSAWLALVTLIAMEIVLGVDNLAFVPILSAK